MLRNAREATLRMLRGSQLPRLLAIGGLALLLQIPIAKIAALVGERQQRRDAAVAEVSGKWGQRQTLVGPALIVPYPHGWTSSQGVLTSAGTRHLVVLPQRLTARGRLTSETLGRGIFSIPVYGVELELSGEFARPDLGALGVDPASVVWERARLALGISDPRAIQSAAAVHWNGARSEFLPGSDELRLMPTGIHAPVDASGAERFEFRVPLSLHGSEGLYLTPFGETTVAELAADSPNPSFQGAWLPRQRAVSAQGFEASWEIPFLGRGFPQAWVATDPPEEAVASSHFGVELVAPVDHYRMAERSVKYAGLFILLTFASVWLLEGLARVQLHPVQYLLLGSALCLFYLLLLSLAEHLGFPQAYALASLAVIALCGAYSRSILRRRSLALCVAAGVAGLYAYLYVLLMNEDYALLFGSLGLLAILAAVMFTTRNVDWFALGSGGAARGDTQTPLAG
jgi:inner membrane protein